MIDVLKWYLFIQVLGLIYLPLTWSVFQRLKSRGLYLAKPLGLLLWGFVYWWLTSLNLLASDLAGTSTVLLFLLALNLFVLWKIGPDRLLNWIKENKKLLLFSEGLFLLSFVSWAIVRAANPEIIHTEKFMEMAFINAILKSPSMPPHDPWLSGYAISYYYFGYLLAAMLIRMTNVAASVGYNLVSALWFGLTALGAYGLLWDFLARKEDLKTKNSEHESGVSHGIYLFALMAPLMMLIVSNWFGIFDVLHARGLGSATFWQGLELPALMTEPFNLSWFPNRGGWSWWQASRVIQDFRLNGSTIEIIDEFPFFTFLLSDIHPHLLGMPFVLLAIAQAFNAFQGGWESKISQFGRFFKISWLQASIGVITLGGIAFLNTWDFPFYLLLIGSAFIWRQVTQEGWKTKHVWNLLVFCLVGGVLSIAAYLPFYFSFASQAGGILPSLSYFTKGKFFLIMFVPLLLPVLGWLLYKRLKLRRWPDHRALFLTAAIVILLFVLSWGLGWLAGRFENLDALLNGAHAAENNQAVLLGSILARLRDPWTMIILFLIIFTVFDLLLSKIAFNRAGSSEVELEVETKQLKYQGNPDTFILMLILLGGLLTIVPEFIYLRDQFGTRMNTIFKFYYQVWILWSLAGSYAVAELFKKSKKRINVVFGTLIAFVGILSLAFSLQQKTSALPAQFGTNALDYLILSIPILFLVWLLWSLIKKSYAQALAVLAMCGSAAGLVYPSVELLNKTEAFMPQDGYSLDGKQDFYLYSGDEMIAAEWLSKADLGVMAEAVADTGGSYTTYNLISTFSGMPTVLGWIGHEAQWRGGYEEIGSRQADLRELYSTSSWERTKAVIDLYNIRYIVVGELERQTYAVDLLKFEENLSKVLDTASVDIYEVKKP